MHRLWALLALLVVAAGVSLSTQDDNWPPPRYQQPDITATIRFTDQATVEKVCGKAPKGWTTRGCAVSGAITVQDPCSPQYQGKDDSYARLICHELGHLNGWSGDHPR